MAGERNITDITHTPEAGGDPEPDARAAESWRPPRPAAARGWPRAAAVFAAAAAATAVCGIPAGFIWGAVAPRVLVQVVSRGAATIVNAQTSAFIVADLWFCLIGVAGGVLTGSFGYWIVIRRRAPRASAIPAADGPAESAGAGAHGPAASTGPAANPGPAAAAGLILGALAAAAIALWIGELNGHAAFRHQLAVRATGTHLHGPLTLGAKSGLAFWPLATALTIVVIEVAVRWRAARRPAPETTAPR